MTNKEDIPQEAPHVFIRGEGGSVFKLDLPLHEDIETRLIKGYLTRVANAEGDPYVEGETDPNIVTLPTERPALNAKKLEWVGWAVAQGMDADDAEALTKDDLIERFGAKATEPISAPPEGVPAPEELVKAKEEAERKLLTTPKLRRKRKLPKLPRASPTPSNPKVGRCTRGGPPPHLRSAR